MTSNTPLPVVQASDQRAVAAALARAWESPETFVLLAARTPVTTTELRTLAQALPLEFRDQHVVLLTSGSTGTPKFVVGSRERAVALARTLHAIQDADDVEETVVALPLTYSYAYVNQFVWAQVHGRRLVVTEGLSAPPLFRTALHTARNAMLCLVGAQVPLLLREFQGDRFPGILRLHFAGGRFPDQHLAQLEVMFPAASVYNNYGCAEALPRLTVRRADAHPDGAVVGQPIPGVELRVTPDEHLEFRSDYRAVGLMEAGVFTRVNDADWLRTGDLAVHVGDAGWRLLGRPGEVFKRYGEKVSLPSLLTVVHSVWAGEASFHVEQVPGREMAHVLTLAPKPEPTDVRRILLSLRDQFPRAHWPIRVDAREMLPRLPNGKIDQRALAETVERTTLWHQRLT
jgi:acyl-CoA synthetase (AMP-forming)/AMP-acid ligase II